ncbi:MAG: putative lipid II flippase FtsW [Clostridia bacterium]|jgi:cell division protein FtsW|nr:putative lipid II flippase FtsW [Clostridia bacterium]
MSKVVNINKNKEKRVAGKCDFVLLFTTLMLVFFGIIMVFSSSYHAALIKTGNILFFVKKQMMWAIIGFVVMIATMNFDYRRYKKLALPMYAGSIILLIAVLIVGKNINNATRWIRIGGVGIQPSEVAKIALILMLALIISSMKDHMKTFKSYLFALTFIGVPILLIFFENVSTAILVAVIGITIIFAGINSFSDFIRFTVPVGLIGILILGGAFLTNPKFKGRLGRLDIWLNPWSDPTGGGLQTINSLYAIGSGGTFGYGLGQSKQKLGFLPEAYNDIIFSVICEELGLIGGIAVLILFLILIWRGIFIAINLEDTFGSLVAVGIITMIATQVIINISVVTNTIPVTGMPLPFISYGGTSLVITMFSIGVLLNISRYVKKRN